MGEKELKPCKCGGKARYRYRLPLHWIECRNKRCGVRTRYYPDQDEQFDPKARQLAINEWNSMTE